jgi:hypothetical protein
MKTGTKLVPIPTLQMSVRVSDGSFESKLEIPVNASRDQLNQIAQMWIQALGQAVQITRTPEDPAPPTQHKPED